MSWLTIILQILSIVPELIKDVEAVIESLQGKSSDARIAAKAQLVEVLASKDPQAIGSVLAALK